MILAGRLAPQHQFLRRLATTTPGGFGRAGPLGKFQGLISGGALIGGDARQEAAVARLQACYNRVTSSLPPGGRGAVGGGVGSGAAAVGLYLHGAVGRGKTMAMDLLKGSAPDHCYRVHYHAFMIDVHKRLHALRHLADPLLFLAEEIAGQAPLLCLDELDVTDVADALVIRRLFEVLVREGSTLVITSNRPPEDQYRGGLNRQLFVPCIELLRAHCEVVSLDRDGEAGRDFRKRGGGQGGGEPKSQYAHPLGRAAEDAADAWWAAMVAKEGHAEEELLVPVGMGRSLRLRRASGGCLRASFEDLCGPKAALGTLDFLAVAGQFHTVLLEGVPVLGPEREDAARRLINLIDLLYEHRTKLFVTADAPEAELFQPPSSAPRGAPFNPGFPGGRPPEGRFGAQEDRGDMHVVDKGGSSGSLTTMVGGMEWSATGRTGASLAALAGGTHGFTFEACRRTASRLHEMRMNYFQPCS